LEILYQDFKLIIVTIIWIVGVNQCFEMADILKLIFLVELHLEWFAILINSTTLMICSHVTGASILFFNWAPHHEGVLVHSWPRY